MKRIIIIIAGLCLFSSFITRAQEPTRLSLETCLELAKANNADLQMSRLEVEKAAEVKKQVFTKYFPQVSASFTGFMAAHSIIEFGIDDIQSEDMKDIIESLYELVADGSDVQREMKLMQRGVSMGANVIQPIYAGGRIVNGNHLAALGIEAAALQAEVTERDRLEQIESSYYLVLGLQSKVITLESALSLLDSLDHVVNTALEAGLVTRSDVLRVSLKRNEFLAKQVQLNNGIRLASRLLCQEIGISYPDEGLLLDDELALMDDEMDFFVFQRGKQRPELRLLDLQVEAEQLRRKMTLGEVLPQVGIGGMFFYGNMIKKEMNGNAVAFLHASIPLSSWWETAHKLNQHDLTIRRAELMREDLTSKMSLQEEQAFNTMVESKALLASDQAALEMAQENYRLCELNYEAGLNTLTDVLEANTLLLQAKNAITDRKISFLTARRRYLDLTK